MQRHGASVGNGQLPRLRRPVYPIATSPSVIISSVVGSGMALADAIARADSHAQQLEKIDVFH